MTIGKNINLYLIDGKSTGRIKCTLANWTGLAYKLPRTEIEKCRDRDDLKQSGVYFLFGENDEDGKEVVYIGQAGIRSNGEGILDRLLEHKKNPLKDYWNEVVIFTTSNNSFGATEISYLESKFYNIAKEANRYEVNNINQPNCGNVTEEKESELEEFIQYSKIIMGVLGHQIFEPLVRDEDLISHDLNINKRDKEEELTLYLNRKIGRSGEETRGICKRTSEGFVVLEGSKIELIDAYHIPKSIKEDRANSKIDKNGILQENILYKSPSYAGSFVIGGKCNGMAEWKNKDGISLKELEKIESENK